MSLLLLSLLLPQAARARLATMAAASGVFLNMNLCLFSRGKRPCVIRRKPNVPFLGDRRD